MTKFLIGSIGFDNATRAVAGLVSGTALFAWVCAIPNPKHPLNKNDGTKWLSIQRWVDTSAFRNSTFNWFAASIAFMFFGFYAVFFNLEEVSLIQTKLIKRETH
jgi:MCP family monocarboxylic acid transporter-like MFS transporter 10